ncbi:MAG: hypothetical protein ACJ71B_08900 [Nitrososphaera sp.]
MKDRMKQIALEHERVNERDEIFSLTRKSRQGLGVPVPGRSALESRLDGTRCEYRKERSGIIMYDLKELG